MSKVKASLKLKSPTVIVQLTPDGLKVSLEAWQHDAPVRLLAGLEIAVQRAIHMWRGRFLIRDTEFGTLNSRAVERQMDDQRKQS